ncbi:hypothetical protein K8R32_02775, partial [bacterium]|nr:hypothetical protein [bacterium]
DEGNGFLCPETRFEFAQKAFAYTADYDRTIADFLSAKTYQEAMECYDSN